MFEQIIQNYANTDLLVPVRPQFLCVKCQNFAEAAPYLLYYKQGKYMITDY